jgi:hypothetical protein
MKKLIVCLLLLLLLFPTMAFANEAPADEGTSDDSVRTITVFDYAIVIVLPSEEGETVSVGVFRIGEDDELEEEAVTSFSLGGILGQSVSKLAKEVEPGSEHGKVVSAFVKNVNEERRDAKKTENEEKKTKENEEDEEAEDDDETEAESEMKKAEKEEAKEAKKVEIEEKKAEKKAAAEAKKANGKKKTKDNKK